MYSMVLMAAMLPSGDAAGFGKKNNGCNGGCHGTVAAAGCTGYAAPAAGCTGGAVVVDSGCCGGGHSRGGFLGHRNRGNSCSGGGFLGHKHKSNSCNGGGYSCNGGGYSCNGGGYAAPAGCNGGGIVVTPTVAPAGPVVMPPKQ